MNTEDFEREKQLFRYTRAYDHGDFDEMSAVLQLAEEDPKLEQMIMEIHEIFAEDEPPMSDEFRKKLHDDFLALLEKHKKGTRRENEI